MLKHATLKITDGAMINVYLGLWIPFDCTIKEAEILNDAINSYLVGEGLKVVIDITESNPPVMKAYFLILVAWSFLIIGTIITGTIVGNTAVLNKSEFGTEIGNPEKTKNNTNLTHLYTLLIHS